MPLLRNIATGSRLLLAPTSLLGVLAVLLGVAFWGMRLQDSSVDKALHDIVEKTNIVANIKGGVATAHAKTYRTLTHIETRYSEDKIAEEAEDTQNEMTKVLEYLGDMSRLPGVSPNEEAIIKASADLARQYQVLIRDTVEIALIEPPQGVVFMMQADKKFVELNLSLALLQQAQDSSMERAYADVKGITQKILGALLLIGVAALVLFFSRVVGRSQESFEEKRGALEAFNQQLEVRVEERTRQLEAQLVKVSNLNRSMEIESAERRKAEQKYRDIFEHATEGIFQTSLSGRIISANLAMARILGYDTPEELQETITDLATEVYVNPGERAEALAQIERDGSLSQFEYAARRKDGVVIWVSVTARVVRDASGEILFHEGTLRDVTRRKQMEEALQKAQADLVAAARQAGMAEIASNVLHNVGNVLNSVNISAGLVSSRMRDSKARGLGKAVQLMNDHEADLAQFLTCDEKGRRLPGYLNKLAAALDAEQRGIVGELGSLTRSVEHIKDIVAAQNSYARATSLVEAVQIRDLLEDALRINAGSLARRRITVVKEFSDVPLLPVDKPRVLQILVNLIRNAEQAMQGAVDRTRRMTLRVNLAGRAEERRLQIEVEDEGEGIAPENMTRIFAHGFTTRHDGHGFGLHSCILAAREMGGTLTARSDGPGKGATFALELPIRSKEAMHACA
jgi:PAS domain S-box-containing protein